MSTKTKKSESLPRPRASKEEARRAIDALSRIKDRTGDTPDTKIVADFLAAAVKKLPSEAAFNADTQRSKASV